MALERSKEQAAMTSFESRKQFTAAELKRALEGEEIGIDQLYAECGVLYIEPSEKFSPEPVIDSLTRKMAAALRSAEASPLHYMGYHTCTCGSRSKSHDFILSDGLITNSLCVHYLAWHRSEIPKEELDKVAKLGSGELEPDASDLAPPLSKAERAALAVQHVHYQQKKLHSPRLQGRLLSLVVKALENPTCAILLRQHLHKDFGITDLRNAPLDEAPTLLPLHRSIVSKDSSRPALPTNQINSPPSVPFTSVGDYTRLYRSGRLSPEDVFPRVVKAIDDSEKQVPALKAFIAWDRIDALSQAARESTNRYRNGTPLGPLDGVPIAIKDELDMVPYPTSVGTRFLGRRAAEKDATVVSRLRTAGALLIGKTNMHEIGILPSGINPHFGAVRNPYDPAYDAGGSSSGSAAAVAAGICPASVGCDGGGSIRVPASFCGVIGLKPTYGRVSEYGAAPLCWSVAHVGPIGATSEDVEVLYSAIAGPDPADSITLFQPPLEVVRRDTDLRGMRIGIYRPWFSDADSEIVAACERVLQEYVKLGAEILDIGIPNLNLILVAHGLTILTEMAVNMSRCGVYQRELGQRTRLLLAIIKTTTSLDYVQAQRVRTRAISDFLSALKTVDVIATPTAPITAPEIKDDELPEGAWSAEQTMETLRFVSPANFTGLPAISIPVGYDRGGLPIGLQVMARPCEEALLLRLAYISESFLQRRLPRVHWRLVG